LFEKNPLRVKGTGVVRKRDVRKKWWSRGISKKVVVPPYDKEGRVVVKKG
jgi:hypothetical protein